MLDKLTLSAGRQVRAGKGGIGTLSLSCSELQEGGCRRLGEWMADARDKNRHGQIIGKDDRQGCVQQEMGGTVDHESCSEPETRLLLGAVFG